MHVSNGIVERGAAGYLHGIDVSGKFVNKPNNPTTIKTTITDNCHRVGSRYRYNIDIGTIIIIIITRVLHYHGNINRLIFFFEIKKFSFSV